MKEGYDLLSVGPFRRNGNFIPTLSFFNTIVSRESMFYFQSSCQVRDCFAWKKILCETSNKDQRTAWRWCNDSGGDMPKKNIKKTDLRSQIGFLFISTFERCYYSKDLLHSNSVLQYRSKSQYFSIFRNFRKFFATAKEAPEEIQLTFLPLWLLCE
jgi:hypothetical protein